MEKPLKVGAISGILVLCLSAIAIFPSILGEFYTPLKILAAILYMALFISSSLFYYSFAVLAKKFNAKLLNVMSWIFIFLTAISAIFYLMIFITSLFAASQGNLAIDNSMVMKTITGLAVDNNLDQTLNTLQQQNLYGAILAIILVLVIIMIAFILIFIALPTILFGIGLLKLGNKVENAKLIGTLDIIAGATMILLIGFLIALVSFVMKVILLWNVSKKFENRRLLKKY